MIDLKATKRFFCSCFHHRFICKALHIENIEALYLLRFYILDLSEQLKIRFIALKAKHKGVLKLYRAQKLTDDKVAHFQNSLGNLIYTSAYFSTTSEYAVAYTFATKPAKRDGIVRVLFEYQVDLNTVQHIALADVREYSAFPEEAEVVVDIGKRQSWI